MSAIPMICRRSRWAGMATAAVLLAAATVAVAPTAHAATSGGRFHTVSPAVRVLDTRTSNTPVGEKQVRTVDLSSAISGTAAAAVINFTVDQPSKSGYLSVAPAGTANIASSSVMNIGAGRTRANSVTVAVAAGNKIDIYNDQGSSNVIVDVVGWYSAAPDSGSDYFPQNPPTRLFDTRDPNSFKDASQAHPLSNSGVYGTLVVTVDYGGATENQKIKAIALNLTVTNTAGPGFLVTWDGSSPQPSTSAINWNAGQTIANTDIVPVRCATASCDNLTFSVQNAVSPSTDVLADVVGYYGTPDTDGFVYLPQAPTRITDTRKNMPFGRLGQGATGSTDLSSYINDQTGAVNVNATAVLPTAVSYLSLFPGSTFPGGVSTLNVAPNEIAPNGAQVTVGGDGVIGAYNNLGSMDVVIDLEGQFLPDSS